MQATMPIEDLIRKRAFELYRERGQEPGHAEEDWQQARFEVEHWPLHVVRLRPLGVRRTPGKPSTVRRDEVLGRIISRIRHLRRPVEN